MNSHEPHPVKTLPRAGRTADEPPARAPETPGGRPTLTQRQLKDYPQSLQNAARALWG